jgi:hypothetical protein
MNGLWVAQRQVLLSGASGRGFDYVLNILLPLELNKRNLKWGHVARSERPDSSVARPVTPDRASGRPVEILMSKPTTLFLWGPYKYVVASFKLSLLDF